MKKRKGRRDGEEERKEEKAIREHEETKEGKGRKPTWHVCLLKTLAVM